MQPTKEMLEMSVAKLEAEELTVLGLSFTRELKSGKAKLRFDYIDSDGNRESWITYLNDESTYSKEDKSRVKKYLEKRHRWEKEK